LHEIGDTDRGDIMNASSPIRRAIKVAAGTVAALLAACTTPVSRDKQQPPEPVPATPERAGVPAAPPSGPQASQAGNPRDYRRDAASHLYARNRDRIYAGRLPPLLYAVGVLQVEVDGAGQVRRLDWMRAPRHAPEVVAEIERTVRAAAPFPAPARMGKVTYTDTWLWDRSGRFQLDTLTEGQD
jgi:hypothetical protein